MVYFFLKAEKIDDEINKLRFLINLMRAYGQMSSDILVCVRIRIMKVQSSMTL